MARTSILRNLCRCTIGDDHDDGDMLSASEAEDIWLSSGMDPDYDFR